MRNSLIEFTYKTAMLSMIIKSSYRPQASDISIETDIFEFTLLRQRTNSDRLQMSAILTQEARQLCFYGLQQTQKFSSNIAFAKAIAQAFLGDDYPPNFIPTSKEMTWIQDSISLALNLQTILTDLDIPNYITGGIAAATYGEPRTTRDLDIVIALIPTKLDILVQSLEAEGFHVPGIEDIRVGRLQTLSITHQETIARADLILADNSEFEQEKFKRQRAIIIPKRGTLYLVSPEDLILSKLRWCQQSQSEKQTRDVLGIMKVQNQNLDINYLNEKAAQLQLCQLLNQVISEAGLSQQNLEH